MLNNNYILTTPRLGLRNWLPSDETPFIEMCQDREVMRYFPSLLSAEESLALGIVNKMIPHDQLMNETMDLAHRIASGATYSMALIKKLIHESLHTNLEESLKLAGPAQDIARQTSDHKEGVKAFVEKRKPNFTGR